MSKLIDELNKEFQKSYTKEKRLLRIERTISIKRCEAEKETTCLAQELQKAKKKK